MLLTHTHTQSNEGVYIRVSINYTAHICLGRFAKAHFCNKSCVTQEVCVEGTDIYACVSAYMYVCFEVDLPCLHCTQSPLALQERQRHPDGETSGGTGGVRTKRKRNKEH